MKRTLAVETTRKIGEKVKIQGWINTRRDHGKIVFLDIRDRSGLLQAVTSQETLAGPEDVVEIIGTVKARPETMVNDKIPTGTVELDIESITVVTKADTLPFPIDTDGHNIKEDLRLKHRYLDLRRPRMANNIRMRHQMVNFFRAWLDKRDFVEIETPILTKTTPEGARDFLVPSRLQPGSFYALPQSPQQYKQMLMVAGMERYFQVARCFRDEDPRADRAYGEFTQLDMEMSFVTQEDILQLIEEMFTQMVKELFPNKRISQTPWPRISHKDAMEKYGSDKPDLRKDKNDPDELAFAWTLDFPLFVEQSEDDFFHGSGAAQFAPSHHMFTAPHPDDVELLKTNPLKVRGLQHDLVLNGSEVGGGSIRIHDAAVQQKVFELIGFSKQQQQQFEHILKAFTYGVPPHGGIAPGIDRLLYMLLGETSLREVMAFPTNTAGRTSVVNAPSIAEEEQLKELGLRSKLKPNKNLDLFGKIQDKYQSLGIKFELIKHKEAMTSEEVSELRNTPLEIGAKALLMMADEKPTLFVLSAADKANTNAIKKLLALSDLHMASKEEVEQITTAKIGAVPPTGSLFNVKTYIDSGLLKHKKIAFNAGRRDTSIIVKSEDFLRAEQPEELAFSK